MQIGEMAEALRLEALTENTDTTREVKGCYCGDLLGSWAEPSGRRVAYRHGQRVNAIAVASLADTAGIILVRCRFGCRCRHVPSRNRRVRHLCLRKPRSKSLHYWVNV